MKFKLPRARALDVDPGAMSGSLRPNPPDLPAPSSCWLRMAISRELRAVYDPYVFFELYDSQRGVLPSYIFAATHGVDHERWTPHENIQWPLFLAMIAEQTGHEFFFSEETFHDAMRMVRDAAFAALAAALKSHLRMLRPDPHAGTFANNHNGRDSPLYDQLHSRAAIASYDVGRVAIGALAPHVGMVRPGDLVTVDRNGRGLPARVFSDALNGTPPSFDDDDRVDALSLALSHARGVLK